MYDLVTLGEAMIRLSPPNFQRLEQARTLDVNVGGSEWNAAIGAARLGLKAAWVSKLTSNALGRMIVDKAREHGVDTSHVVWTSSDRIGLYFVEFGASPRASSVLYDRRGAAIAGLKPEEVDWAKVLAGARVFHSSGITPALGPEARATTAAAIAAARAAGALVTFDMNYRSRLWSAAEARATLAKYLEQVDILITTSDDTEIVFGKTGTPEQVAEEMVRSFGLKCCVLTVRDAPTVLTGRWRSVAYADKLYQSSRATYLELVDRIGSGDAYTAGFIYGYLKTGGDVQTAVEYGDAMSVLKHTIPGDATWFTLQEVEAQLKSSGTKIVR